MLTTLLVYLLYSIKLLSADPLFTRGHHSRSYGYFKLANLYDATLKVLVSPPDLKPMTFRMLGKYINLYYGGTAYMH